MERDLRLAMTHESMHMERDFRLAMVLWTHPLQLPIPTPTARTNGH